MPIFQIPKFLKELVSRPDDAKRHEAGLEFPDQKVREVPVKLLNRHKDIQDYIHAYVQSEVRLAQLGAEHESIEDALDMDIDDPAFVDEKAAAELEAEGLSKLAEENYTLRRVRDMVDDDLKVKAAIAAAAKPPTNPAPVVPAPVVPGPTPPS